MLQCTSCDIHEGQAPKLIVQLVSWIGACTFHYILWCHMVQMTTITFIVTTTPAPVSTFTITNMLLLMTTSINIQFKSLGDRFTRQLTTVKQWTVVTFHTLMTTTCIDNVATTTTTLPPSQDHVQLWSLIWSKDWLVWK